MGSGKTTLGKKLARHLRYRYEDTDQMLEARIGKSIQEIFSSEGEEYFREKETELLRDTINLEGTVISTGGGLPCSERNLSIIKEYGLSVYLEAPAGLLLNRLSRNKTSRPLLAGLENDDLYRYIQEKLKEREVYYRQANYTVQVPVESVETLVKSIGLV